MLPKAWFTTLRPMVSWSQRNDTRMNLQNITASSGTSFSHNMSILGISIMMGIDIIAMSSTENLLSFSARKNILSRLFSPSALIICGVMALRIDVTVKAMAPYIWNAMP